MGLTPELESLLQAARLEAFAPVLAELGVESVADLEFVQDGDFESLENITTLQKRRFCDWKTKTLDEQSKSSSLTSETQQTLEVASSKDSQPSKRLSQSTKVAVCGKPEALRPPGFEPRDPALDVDFHKIFSDPNLSADDVKSLFHDLCKKHHPDKGGNADVFARINKAYNTAVDPLESYLEAGAAAPPPTIEKKEEGYKAAGVPVVPVPPPEDTPEDTGNAEDKEATTHSDPLEPQSMGSRSFRDSVGCLLPKSFRKSSSAPTSLT
jgi:hypothetical protein